jgi:hypothetical protein
LLVGENSTGKTSFLAAARLAEAMRAGLLSPLNFNEEPFNLGAFDEIANFRGGRAGRAESFKLGATFDPRPNGKRREGVSPSRYIVELSNLEGNPTIKEFTLAHEGYEIHVNGSSTGFPVRVNTPSKPKGVALKTGPVEGKHRQGDRWITYRPIQTALAQLLPGHIYSNQIDLDQDEREKLLTMIHPWFDYSGSPAFAAAPIRAQPRRTYEVLSDAPRPQGDHVPMLLAQIVGKEEWKDLQKPLEKFSRASGLFDEIVVKRLGKSESSPFQILVKIGGPSRNLIDVGYGVSQVLPLVVDLLRDDRSRVYLVQQPEVHLHPRAQAELGTLLAVIAKNRKKQLLIETHSDYIVDRVRMEVRKRTIRATDIIVLYFERDRSEVKINPIQLDEDGDLINPPPSYRSFFLEEEGKFLGVSDVHNS